MLTTLSLCLPILLSLSVQDDDPEPQPPTKEQVEAAVEQIEDALEAEDSDAVLAAVQAAISVPHEDVVDALADAATNFELRDVSGAAIDALGRIDHEDAVGKLTRLHSRQSKRIEEDPDWAIGLFRALGRTGDLKALDALAKGSLNGQVLKLDKARILSIGKIRHPEAVEELVGLYNKVRQNETHKYSEVMRTSVAALTGVDFGGGRNAMIEWWNDNKRSLELPEEEPEIEARKLRMTWEGFWNDRKQKEGGRR